MLKRMKSYFENTSVFALLSIGILLCVLIPLTIFGVYTVRSSRDLAVNAYGQALHSVTASIQAPELTSTDFIIQRIHRQLYNAYPLTSVSWYLLDRDNSIVFSGCSSGSCFPRISGPLWTPVPPAIPPIPTHTGALRSARSPLSMTATGSLPFIPGLLCSAPNPRPLSRWSFYPPWS